MDKEPDILENITELAGEIATVSNLISVRSFIAKWRAAQTFDEISLQTLGNLPYNSVTTEKNEIPEDIREELFMVTNPVETLYCEGMIPFKPVKLEDVPEEAKLQTIFHSKQSMDRKKSRLDVQCKSSITFGVSVSDR